MDVVCRYRERDGRPAQLVGMVGAHKQGKSPRAREEMKRASRGLVQVDPSRSVGLHKMKTRQSEYVGKTQLKIACAVLLNFARDKEYID